MTLTLQPTRVATGFDEEAMMVFDDERRLVAVLVHLSDNNEGALGQWYLEAGFSRADGVHPTFQDLDAAEQWLHQRMARA